MDVIYEPRGRAREYAPLAVNLYRGCGHGCLYCWAPAALHMRPGDFFKHPQPRPKVLERLKRHAEAFRGDTRPVLLCFSTDPYQPCEERHRVTRKALEILLENRLSVSILSKGGLRAAVDLDLLAGDGRPHAFGATLTTLSPDLSTCWEPHAAPPDERLEALARAHDLGLQTWASLEPVLDVRETLRVIEASHRFVRHFKVGKLNYHPQGKRIDWPGFRAEVEVLLRGLGFQPTTRSDEYLPGFYYLKRDLVEAV